MFRPASDEVLGLKIKYLHVYTVVGGGIGRADAPGKGMHALINVSTK